MRHLGGQRAILCACLHVACQLLIGDDALLVDEGLSGLVQRGVVEVLGGESGGVDGGEAGSCRSMRCCSTSCILVHLLFPLSATSSVEARQFFHDGLGLALGPPLLRTSRAQRAVDDGDQIGHQILAPISRRD